MKDKAEEYKANGGWSSHLFASNAWDLMCELKKHGTDVTVGRTVVHITRKTDDGAHRLKAYVHHNGRTEEYATITDRRGTELASFHYTEFHKLREFVLLELGMKT